jgi:hypothetical protein
LNQLQARSAQYFTVLKVTPSKLSFTVDLSEMPRTILRLHSVVKPVTPRRILERVSHETPSLNLDESLPRRMKNSPSYAVIQLTTRTANEPYTTAQVGAITLQPWLTVKNSRGSPEKPWKALPGRKESGNEAVDVSTRARTCSIPRKAQPPA